MAIEQQERMTAAAEHWFKQNTFFSLMFIVTVLAPSSVLSVWHARTAAPNNR